MLGKKDIKIYLENIDKQTIYFSKDFEELIKNRHIPPYESLIREEFIPLLINLTDEVKRNLYSEEIINLLQIKFILEKNIQKMNGFNWHMQKLCEEMKRMCLRRNISVEGVTRLYWAYGELIILVKDFRNVVSVNISKTTLQVSNKINIDSTKRIILSIVYGNTNMTGIEKVWDFIYELMQNEILAKDIISNINLHIENACKVVFSDKIIERSFGTAFQKNVIIYLVKSGIAHGFIVKMMKLVNRGAPILIKFNPEEKDVRIFIDLPILFEDSTLRDYSKTASLILHELNHVLEGYTESHATISYVIKLEATSVFAEIIRDPQVYLHKWVPKDLMRSLILNPIKTEKEWIKIKQSPWYIYNIGAIMILQLFLKFIEKKEVIKETGNFDLIEKCIVDYNEDAITILQLVRGMNDRRFFDFYLKKVNHPIISSEGVEILMSKYY